MGQKAGFLRPICSKITPVKGKEIRRRKSEMQERKRRKKFNGCILKGTFHLSELSDRLGHSRRNENFTFNQNYPSRSGNKILNSMLDGNRFSAKTFGKSPFYSQNDWSGHCPAGQFWLLESALSFYNGYFRDSFWPKKLFDGRGLFGSNIKERISLTRKSAKNVPPPSAKKKNFDISCISRFSIQSFRSWVVEHSLLPKFLVA